MILWNVPFDGREQVNWYVIADTSSAAANKALREIREAAPKGKWVHGCPERVREVSREVLRVADGNLLVDDDTTAAPAAARFAAENSTTG